MSSTIRSAAVDVERFFQESFPPLAQAAGETTSASIHPPGNWDRHLDDRLILKKVRYLPSIADALQRVAGEAAQNQSLPTIPHRTVAATFPDTRYRKRQQRSALQPRGEESELAAFYAATVADYCMTIAATLEFRLPVWEHGFMEWSSDPVKRPAGPVAAGYLRVAEEFPACQSLPRLQECWPEMAAISNYFPDLAIWNFKSLDEGGDLPLFELLMQFANETEFPWERCVDPNDCKFSYSNWSRTNPAKQHCTPRTGAKMGYDDPNVLSLDLTKAETWTPPNTMGHSPTAHSAAFHKRARHLMQEVLSPTAFRAKLRSEPFR
ncbi:hypothetical protein C8R46DRAFT_1255401 [Mycena filopes]|nr:hypothetical protein C8R46DRAFT_1255401 [Mycena filopes]